MIKSFEDERSMMIGPELTFAVEIEEISSDKEFFATKFHALCDQIQSEDKNYRENFLLACSEAFSWYKFWVKILLHSRMKTVFSAEFHQKFIQSLRIIPISSSDNNYRNSCEKFELKMKNRFELKRASREENYWKSVTAELQITCADSDEHVIFSCDQSIHIARAIPIKFFQTKLEAIRWRVPLRTHRLSSTSLRTTAISRCWLWSGDLVWGLGRNGLFSSRLKSAMELTRRTWRVFGSSWDSCCWRIFQRQKFPSSWSENFFGWRRGEINLDKSNSSLNFALPRSRTLDWQIFSCFVVALFYWSIICFTMRYTLKFLLMYKGFMNETRGKGVSPITMIWGALVKGEKLC